VKSIIFALHDKTTYKFALRNRSRVTNVHTLHFKNQPRIRTFTLDVHCFQVSRFKRPDLY